MKNRHAAARVFCSACNCEKYISAQMVEKGQSKSCGCQKYTYRPSGLDNKKTKNLIGQKFGKLTVLNCSSEKTKRVEWVCECECGNLKNVPGLYLTQGEIKSCGCDRYKIGENNPLWQGYKEISGKVWSGLKTGAKVRNLEFSITIENAWEKFIEQNRKCRLTNLDIEIGTTASLDRIDSSKGYLIDNIQWLHRHVNVMKWDLEQQYFINMCKLISENNKQ